MTRPDDPRICRTPFAEFNHLSLAEVAEFEALEDRALSEAEELRWMELFDRRIGTAWWYAILEEIGAA